jgi:IS5 family transposase
MVHAERSGHEEALHGTPLFREFAGLNWDTALPGETTILRFRRFWRSTD